MKHHLLSSSNAPLDRLVLERICLDSYSPFFRSVTRNEIALYALVGSVSVYWNGIHLGHIGGRQSVTQPLCHVIRFPYIPGSISAHDITLTLDGFAADLLWVECQTPPAQLRSPLPTLPYLHWNDTVFNDVGSGTHARRVAEVPTPPGFEIYCGETLNVMGGVSSWPAHANEHDRVRFVAKETTWEEVMYYVNPKPGLCIMDGIFTGGERVDETRVIENGTAHVMPLGSHQIQAAPDAWLWYAWFYIGTALQKQYRKFSTDVGIYVK